MKILGITGGVGAGKSTILSYLHERYQARVIQADEVGRLLQEPGQTCWKEMILAFGERIRRPDGTLDREALAAVVFADREKLERLNQIIHPAVKSYILKELETERRRSRTALCVIEAALLLEDGYDRVCDEIWYVYADPQVRIERLAKSRGYTLEKSRQIMRNQLTDREYRKKCKFMIDNSSDIVENTYEQIDKGLVEHGFL